MVSKAPGLRNENSEVAQILPNVPTIKQSFQDSSEAIALPAPVHLVDDHASSETPGLRILSLDGGGVRGLFSTIVLEAIMEKVRQYDLPNSPDALRPCDYFDLIGGTSTGGLLAIMLGRLRMNLVACKMAYKTMASTIFKKGRWRSWGPDYLYFAFNRPWFSGDILKGAIQEVVSQWLSTPEKESLKQGHIVPSEAFLGGLQDTQCKTFVCAVLEGSDKVERLRAYDSSAGGATRCKIWQACRATSAAPLYFPEIEINGQKYWDGGMMSNNPIFEVYDEAKNVCEGRSFDAIVSIGTGKPQHMNPAQGFGIVKYMAAQMTNTEGKHEEFMAKRRVGGLYSRLNEVHDLHKIGMDDWKQLNKVEELALRFIASPEGKTEIDNCARRIARRRNSQF
ncbi:hypothetical protein AWENTII_008850 [Aspergillus wentii]